MAKAKHILIIEDEPFLLELYKLKLEHEGYEVSIADNGDDGLDMAARDLPDMILLDLIIPGINGREVLKRLKSQDKTKNIKIIVISNLNQDEEIARCYRYGADGFLVKANLTPRQICEYISGAFAEKKEENVAAEKIKSVIKEKITLEPGEKDILLIEDQLDILEMYKFRLEKEGYKVETAQNGIWGLKFAKENKYKVIVMDIVMPAMDGLKMLEKLHADSLNMSTPIIVLSNSGQDGDIAVAKKHGASKYLIKADITPAKLVKEIKNLLKKSDKIII